MYELELKFLDDNIKLIEAEDFAELYKQVDYLYNSGNIPIKKLDFWHHILNIFYDKDIQINPFSNLTQVPIGYCFKFQHLPEHLVLPDSINVIRFGAFQQSNISDITLPKNITYIDSEAFAQCPNLTKIIIPDSVKRIDDSAFEDCYYLSNVILPPNLEELGKYAFDTTRIMHTLYVNTDDVNLVWPHKIKVYNNNYDDYDVCSGITGELFGTFKEFRRIVSPN